MLRILARERLVGLGRVQIVGDSDALQEVEDLSHIALWFAEIHML